MRYVVFGRHGPPSRLTADAKYGGLRKDSGVLTRAGRGDDALSHARFTITIAAEVGV